jgi:hypothetical protein
MEAGERLQRGLIERTWVIVAAVLLLSDAALIAGGILRQLDAIQHQTLRLQLQYLAQTIGIFEAALLLGAGLALTQAQANTPGELTILVWLSRLGLLLAILISAASLYASIINPFDGFPGVNARAGAIISAISTFVVGMLALSLCLANLLHIRHSRR